MRYVDRSNVSPPTSLADDDFKKMRMAYLQYLSLPDKERVQHTPPDRHLLHDSNLNNALSKLFSGRCAFCETRTRLETYRFRPTREALPLDKDEFAFMAYGWLADAWQNLYPICKECRPRRLNFFPVDGRRSKAPTAAQYRAYAERNDGNWLLSISERNILLDPCNDQDISSHMIMGRNGFLRPLSPRGEETIAHFGLNRLSLANRRGKERERVVPDLSVFGGRPDSYFASEAWKLETEFPGLIAGYIKSERTGANDSVGRAANPATKRSPARKVGTARAAKKQTRQDWRLSSVRLKSFKSLEKLEFEMPRRKHGREPGQTPALLILGENASGKSSILEAITLALSSEAALEKLGVEAGRLLLDPTFLGDQKKRRRTHSSVELDFADDTGKSQTVSFKLSSKGFQAESAVPANMPVFAYGAYRHYLDDFYEWEPHRGIVSLFRSDNLLSNPEKWLLQISQNKFNMVVRSLRHVFGIGENFNVIERDKKAKRCLVVVELANGKLSRTPLSSVSSGFRTILALTCDVMRWLLDDKRGWNFQTLNDAHGIIMIDEVEAHLHPRWKVRIIEGLRKALPNMTFIVTTHDPLCVRGMHDGEVMVLQRLPGRALGSKLPVVIETLTELPNVSQLTIEQLLTSDLFSLFDTDDPVSGKAMAQLADSLVKAKTDKIDDNSEEGQMLRKFRREIEEALPIGTTQVSRIVHEAVSDYIIKRGNVSANAYAGLRKETKERILEALERV
ncbi:AAA family ATPase [Hoeflea alexandrii]|uniref:AAA family ATPase n=1 Tax=Hoeflea alexandrii TaxID=288436 RepID=UPI0022B025AC|nr:AAA family ATPase [Hoeflea alexandrii]MCZ4289267.1 AAA family ATPase [Hoeflea alexandrii]